jgi:PAS domain-containing protein
MTLAKFTTYHEHRLDIHTMAVIWRANSWLLGRSPRQFQFRYYCSLLVVAARIALCLAVLWCMAWKLVFLYAERDYFAAGINNVILASVSSAVGWILAGTVRNKSETRANQQEALDEGLTEPLLQLTRDALEGSDTAIAIADCKRRVVWMNTAFRLIAGIPCSVRHDPSMPLEYLLELALESTRLRACFHPLDAREDVFAINNKLLCIKATPCEPSTGEVGHVLTLQDVTFQRTLEMAMQRRMAREQEEYARFEARRRIFADQPR